LVELNSNMGTMGHYEPDARYWRVAEKGFDAIPALIAHLEDDRLTRGRMEGCNFSGFNLRVKHVASDILSGIARDDPSREWVPDPGSLVEKADALKWWAEASRVGEEAYVFAHIFPCKADANEMNRHLLRVLMAKYPQHLPRVYRINLEDRPEMESEPLAWAIARSSLPREQKIRLLLKGAVHKDMKHRWAALRMLKELDERRFVELLIETLNGLPKEPAETYWQCPEAKIAGLVLMTDNPRAWQALEKAARRSEVGLRMEIIETIGWRWDSADHLKQRLSFLALFLEDTTVRDTRKKLEKYGGWDRPLLAVRDLAAVQISYLLDGPLNLRDSPSAEEWAKLRKEVREALWLEQ
jgi:hypothetical protein